MKLLTGRHSTENWLETVVDGAAGELSVKYLLGWRSASHRSGMYAKVDTYLL